MIPQRYKCIGRKKGGKKLKAFILSYNEGFQLFMRSLNPIFKFVKKE